MLDIKYIRENPEKVKASTKAKGVDPEIIDEVLDLDDEWRRTLQVAEKLRQERNAIAKLRTQEAVTKGQEVKLELKKLEKELKEIADKYDLALKQIPNPAAEDVKEGKDDRENEILRKVGKPKKFDFEAKDHLALGEALGIIDTQRAAKVSGARFTYLKGDAVLLELALVNFAMETLIKEGFIPTLPPVLIKKDSMEGMGYLEHEGLDDMFVLEKDNLVLIGTSEQSIGPMHKDEVLNIKDLPLRYAGFSPCFRREAGSYGKDTKGILRLHQFDKVEMFSFTRPEDGDKEHEFLLDIEEKLFQALEIPYQVVKMATGDLGAPAARKYDLEAWMPGQAKYREVTSTSTTTDFQARRLNIKYQEKGESNFVHMLNGTAFAMGRTIIAILENNQQKDGSIKIPKVLQKYMGKDTMGK